MLLNQDFESTGRFWTHKSKFYSSPCRLTKKVKLSNVLICGTSCIIFFFQAGHTHALGIHRWFTHNTVYSLRVHYTRLEPANASVIPVVASLHPKSNHSCPAHDIKIVILFTLNQDQAKPTKLIEQDGNWFSCHRKRLRGRRWQSVTIASSHGKCHLGSTRRWHLDKS